MMFGSSHDSNQIGSLVTNPSTVKTNFMYLPYQILLVETLLLFSDAHRRSCVVCTHWNTHHWRIHKSYSYSSQVLNRKIVVPFFKLSRLNSCKNILEKYFIAYFDTYESVATHPSSNFGFSYIIRMCSWWSFSSPLTLPLHACKSYIQQCYNFLHTNPFHFQTQFKSNVWITH